jgi:sec-independent protein translocase protein TatB
MPAGQSPVSRTADGDPVFDLSLPKLLVLAVIALVVFGPNELPKMAAKAGKALRELRRIAEGAKADLREGLGPEFANFDIDDLNPRHFVQKHLLSDLDTEVNGHNGTQPATATAGRAGAAQLLPGEEPPFDTEAT